VMCWALQVVKNRLAEFAREVVEDKGVALRAELRA
jgi:hypothetical protein